MENSLTAMPHRRTGWSIGFTIGFLVAVLVLRNFFNSLPFQLVEHDAFQYLAFSKAIYSASPIPIPPIRSPLIALFIIPDLLISRFLMALCHLGVTMLLYVLGIRLFHNTSGAAFASLSFGLSPWMFIFQTSPLTDLPAIALFLSGLVLWLGACAKFYRPRPFGAGLTKIAPYSSPPVKAGIPSAILAGCCFGLAFLFRFDSILLIAPLIFFTPKGLKRYWLVPFCCMAGPVEFVLDLIVYKQGVYAPWEFLRTNLQTFGTSREAFFQENWVTLGQYAKRDVFHVVKTLWKQFPHLVTFSFFSLFALKKSSNRLLLSLLVPFVLLISYVQPFEPRIYMVKSLPLLALLAANVFVILKHTHLGVKGHQFLTGGIFVLLVVSHSVALAQIHYEPRRFDPGDCVQGKVCSNFPVAVNFHCGTATRALVPTEKTLADMSHLCNFFVYFKNISGYSEPISQVLEKRFNRIIENTAARVYDLR